MQTLIFLCLLPSCYCLGTIFGFQQTVGVKGAVLCNGKPDTNAVIKLYDVEIIFDRKLGEAKPDNTGYFNIQGTAREFSQIDPQLRIYHICNVRKNVQGCHKELKIDIPSKFIHKGTQVEQYYSVNLELAREKGQKAVC